ncbi:TPA: aspartate--ammonia ligase, partial [Candidatus Woesearchaeota archaeon]|nr:aspartate--ammonia ligase [Candidatus Woesearchaeota archaeon]
LQDDLAGTQVPVSFVMKHTGDTVEVVHSLAKWKRYTLGKHGFRHGTGIYTDMDAIRKDEETSPIHSIYVDQWDWERVISREERSLDFLKQVVGSIYDALKETEKLVSREFPELLPRLPGKIHFVHSEELEEMFPDLTPKEREHAIAERLGAVFLIGIGAPLKSGEPHDLRAADYDDWITPTSPKTRGLDGDIIVWDPVRKTSLELSSMGIRVDADSLKKQLAHMGLESREGLEFHKGVLEDTLPLSIGGGIGQSRLCMFMLQKAHIGEVQSSVWPEHVEVEFKEKGVHLL